jgi:hypothetical protein
MSRISAGFGSPNFGFFEMPWMFRDAPSKGICSRMSRKDWEFLRGKAADPSKNRPGIFDRACSVYECKEEF